MTTKYQRVLLKLSGEQLAGKYDSGIDTDLMGWIADEAKKVADQGIQLVIMVGGGNFARGAQIAGHGIRRVTADQMGMLATMMNALALTDVFEHHGIRTRCLSSVFAEQVAEPFVHRLANKHLEKGRVVIVAGGIGRPYLTTDTAAVSLALELDCEVVMKATKVDGVYTKDPAKFDDAVKLTEVSFQQALEDGAIKIMDKAAMGLAMEHEMPVVIFDAMQENNILRVVQGKPVGTTIK
ncbi:MAG: Uridylate kinase [Candidatus Saccharibacteria bacterium]|nr:Uridylate kinase [Candidatus Saccharibacteria bacterium]